MSKENILQKSNSCHCRPLQQLIWNKRSKLCKIWKEVENILGYHFENLVKILEKIGKSLGEIPVSASDNMNSSRDIHYFSRMQHPLIWKNIYPCAAAMCHSKGIPSPSLWTPCIT